VAESARKVESLGASRKIVGIEGNPFDKFGYRLSFAGAVDHRIKDMAHAQDSAGHREGTLRDLHGGKIKIIIAFQQFNGEAH